MVVLQLEIVKIITSKSSTKSTNHRQVSNIVSRRIVDGSRLHTRRIFEHEGGQALSTSRQSIVKLAQQIVSMYPGVWDLFLTATPVTKYAGYLQFPFPDGDYRRSCRGRHDKNIRETFQLPVPLRRRCTLCPAPTVDRSSEAAAGRVSAACSIALFSL